MLFETKELHCTIEVLRLLTKGKTKYSLMFRKTKVSHTTLQRVLKELNSKSFIRKYDIGHMNVDYEIAPKGKDLLELLNKLKILIK